MPPPRQKTGIAARRADGYGVRRRTKGAAMFSHVVIFWTKPDVLGAADSLLAGAQKYLATIPGIHQHAGQMEAISNAHIRRRILRISLCRFLGVKR